MIRPRRSKLRLRSFAVLSISVAFVAAACGSDNNNASSGGSTAPTTKTTDGGASAASTPSTDAAASDGRVEIRWFVGLGTGSQAPQIDREKAVIDEYNKSQDKIHLTAEFVDNKVAKDTLATEIAGGNPPDLIGPVGREGANAFSGQYLNLDPLIKSSGIDLSNYEPEQIEARRLPDGTIDSLPFASYPQAFFYNKDLFDEAGLPYPPAKYGEKYGVGTPYEGDWDMNKVEEIAKILTVDANGVAASDPGFDKTKVAQWGFVHQFTDAPRAQGTFFGAGNIVSADGTAKVPDNWLTEWKWYHHMIFDVGATPSQTDLDGDVLAGNPFNSGKVAMADTHLWYTCCLTDGATPPKFKTFWDVGAMPAYDGKVTVKLHADTFRIDKDTKHPNETFDVLQWIQGPGAAELLTIYGAMPARIDLREPYFKTLDANFTQGVNWQVFLDGLAYPDNPSHETDMPSFIESDDRIKELTKQINSDPNLDLDAAAKDMESDLNAIWKAAGS